LAFTKESYSLALPVVHEGLFNFHCSFYICLIIMRQSKFFQSKLRRSISRYFLSLHIYLKITRILYPRIDAKLPHAHTGCLERGSRQHCLPHKYRRCQALRNGWATMITDAHLCRELIDTQSVADLAHTNILYVKHMDLIYCLGALQYPSLSIPLVFLSLSLFFFVNPTSLLSALPHL